MELSDMWQATANGARIILRISIEDKCPTNERMTPDEIETLLHKSGYIERSELQNRLLSLMEEREQKLRCVKN